MSRHHRLRASFAAVLFFPIVMVGCGTDDRNEPDEPVPTATATAESEAAPDQYVHGVCTAAARMFASYRKSFQENRESLGGMDPTDAYARTARAPFAVLVTDLEQLTPPAEAASAHAETVRQAKEVLDALNQGDRQKLLSLRGTPDTGTWKQVIDLSAELKSRFADVSLTVESCQGLAASGAGNPFQ